jgi:hypothetical protein
MTTFTISWGPRTATSRSKFRSPTSHLWFEISVAAIQEFCEAITLIKRYISTLKKTCFCHKGMKIVPQMVKIWFPCSSMHRMWRLWCTLTISCLMPQTERPFRFHSDGWRKLPLRTWDNPKETLVGSLLDRTAELQKLYILQGIQLRKRTSRQI